MSGISKILAGVMGLAILLVAPSAFAAKYLVSVNGTMISGLDQGLFGTSGDLAGEKFLANYLVDSTKIYDTVPGVYQIVSPAPLSLTIAGVTHDFPYFGPVYGGVMSDFAIANVGSLGFNFLSSVDADPVSVEGFTFTAYSPWFQPTLDFGGSAIISVTGSGSFGATLCCCPSCSDKLPEFRAYGDFAIDTVRVTAIPEPATWAMMITGFALAGAALRRRRVVAA